VYLFYECLCVFVNVCVRFTVLWHPVCFSTTMMFSARTPWTEQNSLTHDSEVFLRGGIQFLSRLSRHIYAVADLIGVIARYT